MDLERLRDDCTNEICNSIASELSEEARTTIARIVGQALLKAAGVMNHRSKEAVVYFCGPEADLAHKIQREMDQQRDMLVANLMALR